MYHSRQEDNIDEDEDQEHEHGVDQVSPKRENSNLKPKEISV